MLLRLGGVLVTTGLVCALFLGSLFALAGVGLMVIAAFVLALALEDMLTASEATDRPGDIETAALTDESSKRG